MPCRLLRATGRRSTSFPRRLGQVCLKPLPKGTSPAPELESFENGEAAKACGASSAMRCHLKCTWKQAGGADRRQFP